MNLACTVCETLKDAALTILFVVRVCVCSRLWELRLKVGFFCQCVIDGLKVTLLHYVKSLEDTEEKKKKTFLTHTSERNDNSKVCFKMSPFDYTEPSRSAIFLLLLCSLCLNVINGHFCTKR